MTQQADESLSEWPDAPERIYLQVCEESECGDTFQWHDDHGEITWCAEKQSDRDIEYVRADRALRASTAGGEVAGWISSHELSQLKRGYPQLISMVESGKKNLPLYSAPPSHAGDEALLRQCLEALESCDEGDTSTGHVIHMSYDVPAVHNAIAALRERLAKEG